MTTKRFTITGVTVTPEIIKAVPVVQNPDHPTTWGWFTAARHLSVRPSASREMAYAIAWQAANRERSNVRIYANTGDGWDQVDIVEPGEFEVCEWWPDRNQRAGARGESCPREAVVSVGKATNWHLCEPCAALPRFTRLARYGWLPGHYKATRES
jgi:hypothetical protein